MSVKEKQPSSSLLIAIYLFGLVASLSVWTAPEETLLEYVSIVIALITFLSVVGLVYVDTKRLEDFAKAKGMVSPFRPRTWVVLTFLIWILAIPIYLYKRRRFLGSLKV